MKIKKIILNKNNERGGMLIELLLTLALVAVVLPFIINFQKSRIERSENIAIEKQIETVQSALEKYINTNKKELLKTVGKNITRVEVSDLADYGISEDSLKQYGDKLQIRILKSSDNNGHSTLQGIIVLNDKNISPIRTREIINLGNNKMGFVEKGKAFGAFGTWHGNAVDFGIEGLHGIVGTTNTKLDTNEYLWRIPSENSTDATMESDLNLAGHNITETKLLDSDSAKFEEILKSEKSVSDNLTFQKRVIVDKKVTIKDAVVAGTLSSDSRSMDVSGILTLANSARFASFTTDDMWVNNLNLSGFSVLNPSGSDATVLKVNKTIDMVAGHVTAMFVTIGFDNSVTPKLIVKSRIEDSSDSNYFWDANTSTANLSDISLAELSRMAPLIVKKEAATKTTSSQSFNSVVTNDNATASDFMNAISEIQKKVKLKYNQLNLN
ncbi:MAG TPA: hypothetical protein PKJ33_04360 [Alphaproteobacteria bacterium]|nr:hypothetical protein [Alphaproteobacteria bacterium]